MPRMRSFLTLLALLLAGALAASASPITYAFTGLTQAGYTYQGQFTFDAASSTVPNFYFEIPSQGPFIGSNGPDASAQEQADDGGGLFFLFSNSASDPVPYDAAIGLDFTTLPGALTLNFTVDGNPTESAVALGVPGNAFFDPFVSGSAQAVPEPGSWALLLGGLLLGGACLKACRRESVTV